MKNKPQCPNGHGEMVIWKSWVMKGRGRKKQHNPTGFKAILYKCPQCGVTLRKHTGIGKENQ